MSVQFGQAKRKWIAEFKESELAGKVSFVYEGKIIVFRGDAGMIRATWNRCRHQSGKFIRSPDCVLTCAVHGWKLDVSSMKYVNPQGDLRQEELIVEKTADGNFALFEKIPDEPWGENQSLSLQAGELTVRFYSHACVEITSGNRTLFTDPWITGPAFTRGWWLAHRPPEDWLDSLSKASGIYISHNHSDHLSLPTLRRLAAKNPKVPVFIPNFESESCEMLLREAGMTEIHKVPFNVWQPWGDFGRFMILLDGAGRDDSGMLFEYKGHRLLNTVDCANLNNGTLPKAEMLLSAFASGASGYPICWNEQYTEEHIAQYLKRDRLQLLRGVVDVALAAKARYVLPFAGYFTEAHPSDAFVKKMNIKNTPMDLREALAKVAPEVFTWIPKAGAVFDVGTGQVSEDRVSNQDQIDYDFETYLSEIRKSAALPVLGTMEGVKRYFEWAGYRGDIILHVIEMDDDFRETYREFYIDLNSLEFVEGRPERPHRYERMKVRKDVFRHVMRHGFSWEEISIGFQGRFYRDPDRYNMDFWGHFQNKLPKKLPDWENTNKLKA